MRRIAVSQRVDSHPSRGEKRDALDQRWAACLESLQMLAVPVPNGLADPVAWALAMQVDAMLLTGGNDLAEAVERDTTEARLLELAADAGWPVLGVCRGLQMMNQFLGGSLVDVSGHVATRHGLRAHELACNALAPLTMAGASTIQVNSYHRSGISLAGLAPAMRAVLLSPQGQVEAAEHRSLRWAGVMWHPEREPSLAEHDHLLLTHILARP